MVLSKRADKLYLNAIMHSKLIWRLLLCLLQKCTNVCPVYFSNCIFSDRRHNSNHKLLLLTPARLFAFLLHYNERMMVPFIIKQQNERGKKIWFEPRRTRVCVRTCVCFVYGNALFLSAELVIWADPCKGTLSLCSPAIGLTFVLSHSHLFIWRSGNERMVSCARRIAWRRKAGTDIFLRSSAVRWECCSL